MGFFRKFSMFRRSIPLRKKLVFMQISTKACYKLMVWFWWGWSSIPKVLKIASLQCLYNTQKKVKDEVNFWHADKHQSFLQVDTIIIYHSSILTLLKVISLQYIYNISKNKLGMEFVFCMQKFLQVGIILFDGSAETCPKYPK